MADTDYLVMRQDDEDLKTWHVVDTGVSAHSADAACRMLAEVNDQAGNYVAVPIRSWNPTEQKKTTTTVWKSVRS